MATWINYLLIGAGATACPTVRYSEISAAWICGCRNPETCPGVLEDAAAHGRMITKQHTD